MVLRLAFMGTPQFSVPVLQALAAAGHDIAAVYSQPPRPAGRRGLGLTRSPVHCEAERLGLPVHTPVSLRSAEEQARFRDLRLDAAVVVAYGLLLPQAVLQAPRHGCLNAHASLLPRWRGAAPIQRAIMAGDAETGIMIMQMDAGLDTGPIALTEKIAIAEDMTADAVQERLAGLAAGLMVRAVHDLEHGRLRLVAQSGDGVTYAHKISKQETRIDWDRPALEVHKHVCGLSSFPGAWCEMDIAGKRERVKVLATRAVAGPAGRPGHFDAQSCTVACRQGAVALLQLQKAGGKPLAVQDFMRGATVTAVF